MIYAYVRVSTNEQSYNSQLAELKKFGYTQLFEDKLTGRNFDRKGFKMMDMALQKGDVVLVWRLDRLGRSLLDIMKFAASLKERGVNIVSLKDGVDTRTPVGRLMLGLMASFAEYEYDTMKERQSAGIIARKESGLPTGRPKGLSKLQIEKVMTVQRLSKEGYSNAEIGRMLNIKSMNTVRKYKDYRI